MEHITSYVFAKATPDELSDRVSGLIAKGMRPFGSPVLLDNGMVGQALVSYDKAISTSATLGAIEVELKAISATLSRHLTGQ
jgi:hypothetical protein